MQLAVFESQPDAQFDDSPSIVLLHGGGVGGWSWQPVVERLRDRYHLLVPDLPGQGRSLDVGPFTFPRAAGLVADLIHTRARDGRAHIAGLSLGAQTAVQLLATASELMIGAFLSGALVRKLPGMSTIRPMLALYNPFKDQPFLVRANMRSLGVPAEYYEQFAADTHSATVDSLASILAANMSFGLPGGLDRVTAPVLVTVGEKEFGIMRQSGRDLARAIPGAKAYTVSGVGHNWPLTAADLYSRTLVSWVDGMPLPSELKPL